MECGFALGMISIKPQKMCLSSHLRGVKDLAVLCRIISCFASPGV